MDSLVDDSGRIDRELVGPAVTVGGHRLEPVARMVGRAHRTGGGVQIKPLRVRVVDAEGQERTVAIFDLTRQLLRAIAGVGLALASACGLLVVLRKFMRCSG